MGFDQDLVVANACALSPSADMAQGPERDLCEQVTELLPPRLVAQAVAPVPRSVPRRVPVAGLDSAGWGGVLLFHGDLRKPLVPVSWLLDR